MVRRGRAERETAETSVSVEIEIDGSGRAEISTGVGFFDHLLHLLAHHSGMDLRVEARIFNLFNSQPALKVDQDLWLNDDNTGPNPNFGTGTTFAPSRRFAFSATFLF